MKQVTKTIVGLGLILSLGLVLWTGCVKKIEYNWIQAQAIWQEMVVLNQGFKAIVYADPKPMLRELYQKASANIEKLNQLKGQVKVANFPLDWKTNFDQGLQANISYYKFCQLIIDKRAQSGQSYDELRDSARDALSFYQQVLQKDWPELPRETFQIAAKIEGLIVASQSSSKPKVGRQISRIAQPFVIARGVGICPVSQVRYLTESDLASRSAWELDIIRNEIYARYGRHFVKTKYQTYFNAQSWYEVSQNYSDSLLSSVEKRNAQYVRQYQLQKGLITD